jgi:hypothetical protein
MTPELERAIKRYTQFFGSYKQSGELKKVQVWLTVNDGRIEFLTDGQSFKVKRARRNPRVICYLGSENGPAISGKATIVTDKQALQRTYRAYWKTHPLGMIFLALILSRRIKSGRQILVRVQPDEPNPLAGITNPVV